MNPAWMLLPLPTLANVEILGAGESVRALNGALDNCLARGFGFLRGTILRMFGSARPTDLPWIGSSLQLWVASDGCRALVALHNTFPKNVCYLDG